MHPASAARRRDAPGAASSWQKQVWECRATFAVSLGSSDGDRDYLRIFEAMDGPFLHVERADHRGLVALGLLVAHGVLGLLGAAQRHLQWFHVVFLSMDLGRPAARRAATSARAERRPSCRPSVFRASAGSGQPLSGGDVKWPSAKRLA